MTQPVASDEALVRSEARANLAGRALHIAVVCVLALVLIAAGVLYVQADRQPDHLREQDIRIAVATTVCVDRLYPSISFNSLLTCVDGLLKGKP